MKRIITVEILNPIGNKVCDLYDSTCSFPGQITDIKIQHDKKELTTFTFRLPTKIIDEETGDIIDNPRWKYICNEYKVRYTENGRSDIYVIKSPKETDNGVSITETVTCLHLAEQLKTRNVAVSREGLVGNARMHLERILQGTGWTCGQVDDFYEESLYEKYFDVSNSIINTPDDGAFGSYAEIRSATGASQWDDETGWLDADIRVTSVGKNLCDGMIEKGGIDEATGLPAYSDSTTRYRSINHVYVKPFIGKTVVISGTNVGGVIWHLYDENKRMVAVVQGGMSLLLTASSRCAYIKYQILANSAGDASFSAPPMNVQIETGSIATRYTAYTVPYSVQFSLGKYDTINRNQIIRKTIYNEETKTVSEADEGTVENIAIYSIKMYDDGWIYAENKGPGGINATFAYSVTKETGGALREKYRNISKESGSTAYDEIMQLEDVIGGRAVFNGDTRTVDFVRVVGGDTKLAFKPQYNAKSIERTRSSNEFITRLYAINQETESGYIGIEDVNPLGTNFVMNFDHFDIDAEKQEAIRQFEITMRGIKPRSKEATDLYVANSTQVNSMVGQTPMGFANIASINGIQIKLSGGNIYSYLDKKTPTAGDIAYIRDKNGQWVRFEIEDYYNGSKTIILNKAPENGSIIWWMSGIPAGTVGAQIITLNAQNERLDNYESQLKTLEEKTDPTDDEKEKINQLKENIKTIKQKIIDISNGTEDSQGLNENFARLVVQVENFNEALKAIEDVTDEKIDALDALDNALGEIVYEGVFPQGEYAAGQELALYEDMLAYLEKHCHPQAEYSVTAVDRADFGDEYALEKIRFGDIVYVDDEQLGMANVPAEVTSYTDEPLKPSSNAFKLDNFDQNPIEMFEEIVSASKTIAESKYKYDKLASLVSADGVISKDVMKKSLDDFEISSKEDIEQLIRSYFTTDIIDNAGINWSKIVLLSDEITLRAGTTALEITNNRIKATVEGPLNDISERVSTIEQTSGEITAKVEEVENNVGDLERRINSAELKITPDAIVSTVTQNVLVGGRNLFENSAEMTSGIIRSYSAPEMTFGEGEDASVPSGKYISLKMSVSSGTAYQGGPYLSSKDAPVNVYPKLVDGQTYTVSVWAKCSTAKTIGKMDVDILKDKVFQKIPNLSTKWQRYVVTGVFDASLPYSGVMTFYYGSQWANGDVFYLSSPQVEAGSIATDWSPAPEDIENDVNDLDKRVFNAESSITQTAEEIRLEVSQEVQTLDGKISANSSAITETADQIRLEVSEEVQTLDGKISANSSAITQTAKEIRLEVNEVIGGTNLVKNSAKGASGTGYPLVTYELSDAPLEGETMTVTIWDAISQTAKKWGIYHGGGTVELCAMTAADHKGDGKFSKTFAFKNAATTDGKGQILVYPMNDAGAAAGGTASIGKIKIERGSISTEWTASPMDAPSEVIAGSTVAINKDEVSISTPKFEVNTNGAKFIIPGYDENGAAMVEMDKDTVTMGSLQIRGELRAPNMMEMHPGGIFESVADAAEAINGKYLTGDVTVLTWASTDGAVFRNVTGPGRVLITVPNIIGYLGAVPRSERNGAVVIEALDGTHTLTVQSSGKAWESVRLDIGQIEAMGLRGRTLKFSCFAGSATTDVFPAVMMVATYAGTRLLSINYRPETDPLTSHERIEFTFTIPEDVEYDDHLYLHFYISEDTASPAEARAAFTYIQLRMDQGVALDPNNISGRGCNLNLRLEGCTAQFYLNKLSFVDALRVYHSSVSAHRCVFGLDEEPAGGMLMWGGAGVICDCSGTSRLADKKGIEATGGGAIKLYGTVPPGARKGLIDDSDMTNVSTVGGSVTLPAQKDCEATSSGTYSGSSWWTSDAALRQGYTTANGKLVGAVWFNLPAMGTLSKMTLRLKRAEGYGKGGDVTVRVYGTTAAAKSGNPAASGKISTKYVSKSMGPGEVKNFDVTQIYNEKACSGFVVMVGDSSVMSGKTYSDNFARFVGTGGGKDTKPMLTVNYT